MLTGKQQYIFQPLKEAAWRAYCARKKMQNQDDQAKNAWYRKVLVDNLGIYSTKEIVSGEEEKFDQLCLCFATIACNQAQIDYWSRASERRALWRLELTMKNAGVDMRYIQGIARNMGIDSRPIHELPAELILKLNAAVYIYMKRKERARKPICA